ncbi:hypothetical protein B0H17DRAFT_1157179 [Mycena rosella]|uniref:Calcineurin-like phosphoesterase domain-containing protein n=1 Tax=Mycena rosella TaxID=1033263 RepID=A0AAD7GNM0_MYCRO|nr:hypothetical protein B0H17DRAFT_1157179 [Mycena rosella]
MSQTPVIINPMNARSDMFTRSWNRLLEPSKPNCRRRNVITATRFGGPLQRYEYVVFIHSVRKCAWPDSDIASNVAWPPTHVLLVADPQILDKRSYPDRAPSLTFISQLLVDLNLRKSWRAALRTRPDAVVFLEIFHVRRRVSARAYRVSGQALTRFVKQIREIFSTVPKHFPIGHADSSYFIPGNHDTGLGVSEHFSERAGARYKSHFGPLNSHVTISNHSIVFLDAPSLVDEEFRRTDSGNSYSNWQPVPAFSKSGNQDPVVLFTHIPLSRPDGASCGPNRERGTIRRGVGFGYQNTLGKPASDFLLENLRPSVVFRHAREVTVKSLSMAMGIRQPGFQLLSLVPPHSVQGRSSHADSLCLLPDQLGIYLSTYIPFLVLSLLVLCAANIHRICSPRQAKRQSAPGSTNSPSYAPLSGALHDNDLTLPRPTPSLSKKAARPMYSRTFVLLGRRRRITIGSESIASLAGTIFSCCGNQDVPQSRGFAAGFLYDVRDVAVYPLGIFGVLSWWMFR